MTGPQRKVSLTDCDREPIHVPGSIQAHGSLIALNDAREVVAWSEDLEADVRRVEGRAATLKDLIGEEDAARLTPFLDAGESRAIFPVALSDGRRKALVHRNPQGFGVVELEDTSLSTEELAGVLRHTQAVTQQLRRLEDSQALGQALAVAVRELTGFDRVMVYRFAEDWHGWVVAESRTEEIESFLGIHFPASDIPAQARALYERSPLRLIADVGSAPRALRSRSTGPDPFALDLSDAVLRSVSPIHIQYLKNMDVAASMSISLLRGGSLWGLVACHHRTPRRVPFEVRQACELLSQFVSGHIELHDELLRSRDLGAARLVLQNLAEHLVPETLLCDSLSARADDLFAIAKSDALVISSDGRTEVHGVDAETEAVETWLRRLPIPSEDEPWATHELLFDAPGPFDPPMAGALVVRATSDASTTVVWLRAERIRTLHWAGDPEKPVVRDEGGLERLHPRESFTKWSQEQRGTAEPWTETEIEAARELKTLILSPSVHSAYALREQAAELEQVNTALTRSNDELERFAYAASHDLRAPLRAVKNIVEWLREDEGPRLGEQAQEYLQLMDSRVERMDRMMVDLLAYARAGREQVESETVDLNSIVAEVFESISKPTGIQLVSDSLPTVHGAHVPYMQIILNLVANAVKHHDKTQGRVWVGARQQGEALLIIVEDDGPGIPTEHRSRVFEMFTTLVSRDTVEGSGIGLPLVRRYARSLGGDAWIEKVSPRGTRVVVKVFPESIDD